MGPTKPLLVGMAEVIPDDIHENTLVRILLRVGVKDLIRCKSVCKSWRSLISHPRFIKAHLNHNYQSNANGHKRIRGEVVKDGSRYTIVGSSDGMLIKEDPSSARV